MRINLVLFNEVKHRSKHTCNILSAQFSSPTSFNRDEVPTMAEELHLFHLHCGSCIIWWGTGRAYGRALWHQPIWGGPSEPPTGRPVTTRICHHQGRLHPTSSSNTTVVELARLWLCGSWDTNQLPWTPVIAVHFHHGNQAETEMQNRVGAANSIVVIASLPQMLSPLFPAAVPLLHFRQDPRGSQWREEQISATEEKNHQALS